MIQGCDQAVICAYVFNELPEIYKKVCEKKVRMITSMSDVKTTKNMVTCNECRFKSSMVDMKIHMKHSYAKKSRGLKRSSILTPLPNPSKREKSLQSPISSFEIINCEEAMSMSILSSTLEPEQNEASTSTAVQILSTFECDLCHHVAESKEMLDEHNNQLHRAINLESYSCESCDLVFNSMSDLEQHILEKHTQEPSPKIILIPCKQCDFHATSVPVMGDHMNTIHAAPDLKCKNKSVLETQQVEVQPLKNRF